MVMHQVLNMVHHLVHDHVMITENKKVSEAEIIPISLEVVEWLVGLLVLSFMLKFLC